MAILAFKCFYQNNVLMSAKSYHCNTPLYHYNCWHSREHCYNKKIKISALAKILLPNTELCTAHICCLTFLHLEKILDLTLQGW